MTENNCPKDLNGKIFGEILTQVQTIPTNDETKHTQSSKPQVYLFSKFDLILQYHQLYLFFKQFDNSYRIPRKISPPTEPTEFTEPNELTKPTELTELTEPTVPKSRSIHSRLGYRNEVYGRDSKGYYPVHLKKRRKTRFPRTRNTQNTTPDMEHEKTMISGKTKLNRMDSIHIRLDNGSVQKRR